MQLRGGAGVFPELIVGDNLHASLFATQVSRPERQARIERLLESLPGARRPARAWPRATCPAGSSRCSRSAMALVHEPEILLIDELSLGLAPLVVEELLAVVEALKAAGQTMIVVEQSLNIALAFADRAVFMEKGQVRFEGPARELAERDDLVRAVFLGGEGG